jgi:hypothetical protein
VKAWILVVRPPRERPMARLCSPFCPSGAALGLRRRSRIAPGKWSARSGERPERPDLAPLAARGTKPIVDGRVRPGEGPRCVRLNVRLRRKRGSLRPGFEAKVSAFGACLWVSVRLPWVASGWTAQGGFLPVCLEAADAPKRTWLWRPHAAYGRIVSVSLPFSANPIDDQRHLPIGG